MFCSPARAQGGADSLCIPDQAVIPGQRGVWFPVLANTTAPIQGFQLMGTFDPELLTAVGCSLEFTSIPGPEPELWECRLLESRFEIGVLFDFEVPFDRKALPPGRDRVLVHLIFDVSEQAAPGTETFVTLVNSGDISRIQNIFVVGNSSVLPLLKPSRVEIRPGTPPREMFIRGDADADDSVELTDAIRILNFLFRSGPPPRCMDAADVDDRGRVDLTSAVSLLNFLFLGGSLPSVPFPNLGLDPTEDALPECGAGP